MLDKRESTGFGADIHFRAPGDLMARVHAVARRNGMTASNFMRCAIIEAVEREKGHESPDVKLSLQAQIDGLKAQIDLLCYRLDN